MPKGYFFSQMVKDGDELNHSIKAKGKLYDNLVKELPEGTKVEVFINIVGKKASNAQIARVHVMIRELAAEIGYSFQETKLQVKRKAGLCFNRDGQEYCKSFGDCDIQEMSSVIQTIIDMGDFVGANLR